MVVSTEDSFDCTATAAVHEAGTETTLDPEESDELDRLLEESASWLLQTEATRLHLAR